MGFLADKQVLLIAPKFYDYHNNIIKSLEFQGATVQFWAEMDHSLLFRLSNKFSKTWKLKISQKYIAKLTSRVMKDQFDIVLVIRGGYLSCEALKYLHEQLPKARFAMYQWDSVRQNNYLHLIDLFDVVQTFDMDDAQKYGLTYLPLFYSEQYKKISDQEGSVKYDLVFFGAYHSDRLKVIKTLHEWCEQNGLNFFSHLYISKLAMLRLLVIGEIRFSELKYLKTYSASTDKIISIYRQTKAVLDIELNIQNGLTMRTFEVLGANLKLVTSNNNIRNEAFYDPKRIYVFDRKKPNLDMSFFNNDNQVNNRFAEYYIDEWLAKVLSI